MSGNVVLKYENANNDFLPFTDLQIQKPCVRYFVLLIKFPAYVFPPPPENMKKPWSPDLPVDNHSYSSDFASVPDREGEKELAPDGTEEKKEREKKHTNFTLCNVCNIQLNSAAQAQIHYNGKSHQKRLKQLSNGNLKSDNGKH